jgi:hypothetical protein
MAYLRLYETPGNGIGGGSSEIESRNPEPTVHFLIVITAPLSNSK